MVYNLDQELLGDIIFPEVQNISCVHDSFYCKKYLSKNWRPFPTKRLSGEFNFIGSDGPKELDDPCPLACRPANHIGWTQC